MFEEKKIKKIWDKRQKIQKNSNMLENKFEAELKNSCI